MKFGPTNVSAALFLACSLAACGGSGPDLDQIRQDFDSPTGDTSDKDSLIALNGKRSAGGPSAAGLAAGQSFGFGLSAAGDANAYRRIAPRVMFDREVRYLRALVAGRGVQALRSSDVDADECVDNEAAAKALAGLDPRTGGSASFSYEVDLARCTDGLLTGTMSVDAEIEISRTHARFSVEQVMTNVCEARAQEACIDGTYVIEMEMTADEAAREASISMIGGWDLQASWLEDGKRLDAHVKGGIRLGGEGNDSFSSASLEYLYYVTTKDGEEVSFVLKISADSEGNATMTIKGRDGTTVECNFTSEGGRCTGPEGEISWEEAEEQAIYEADWFRS